MRCGAVFLQALPGQALSGQALPRTEHRAGGFSAGSLGWPVLTTYQRETCPPEACEPKAPAND